MHPLLSLDRIRTALDLGSFWVKNERRNPIDSFKDRFFTVCLSRAKALGAPAVVIASNGNGGHLRPLTRQRPKFRQVGSIPHGATVVAIVTATGLTDPASILETTDPLPATAPKIADLLQDTGRSA